MLEIWPVLPFQITSIALLNTTNVVITWNTTGTTNIVQVTDGTGPSGSFSAGGFTDLATNVVTAPTAGYWDMGGATNYPARYYRIRSPL
jgi:hypothetical protein